MFTIHTFLQNKKTSVLFITEVLVMLLTENRLI